MADLLRDVTANGAGSGVALSGPCTLFVENNSVFAGARVHVEYATNDTAAEYSPIGHEFTSPGSVQCNAQGSYYLRGVVTSANTSTAGGTRTTSVSLEAVQ
jgi:hypothetical protein